ncbi:MAG: DUF433 domain-containing protein [Ignavibacteriae bacterium]|nr:DUF433 domain-containing protein [Ignavibacteriota bacterium]
MDTVTNKHKYVTKRESTGEPIINDTGVTVRAIAELWLQGAQPEEIVLHIPHLKLSQVFDALSYYDDHQEEIDRLIKANTVPEEIRGTRLTLFQSMETKSQSSAA